MEVIIHASLNDACAEADLLRANCRSDVCELKAFEYDFHWEQLYFSATDFGSKMIDVIGVRSDVMIVFRIPSFLINEFEFLFDA